MAGSLTVRQRESLEALRARAASVLDWFAFQRAGRVIFVRPVPDDDGPDLVLPAETLKALADGGYIELFAARFRLG